MSKTRSNTTGRSLPTQSIRVHKWFLWVLVAQSVVFWVVFCRSIFVLLSFFFWPVLCLSFSVYTLDYPSFGLCYVCPSRFTLQITPLLVCVMSVLLGLRFRLPFFWPVLFCPSRFTLQITPILACVILSFSVYTLDYPSFGLCYVCPSRFTLQIFDL